ncbi:MAG: segregation/condensation protein A [Bacteroidetes bacterium]|nr:MAG: segregation/condensation protein A [Bacteroidota bacterium]
MYRIRLQQFEGPLDLLLFFIRRDELNIYDIPIGDITDEFLEYVKLLKDVDLDSSGEFLYMASLLINIKARMLLPGQELDEAGEPIDPRLELVDRLLEYVRFKEATESLESRWDERSGQFTRGLASTDLALDPETKEELLDATVFDLVSALRRILTTIEADQHVHEVDAETYTVEEQCEYLRAVLLIQSKSSFVSLVTGKPKVFVITAFLAILEMAKSGELNIFLQGEPDDFYVELTQASSEKQEATSSSIKMDETQTDG